MTEYDYSPAAYERHIEKLARVEHWVTDQRYCAPGYSSPFVPRNQSSVPVPHGPPRTREAAMPSSRTRAMSPTHQGDHTRHSSSSRSRSQPRAAPVRSQTVPVTQQRAVVYPPNHAPPHVVYHPPHVTLPPVPVGANAVYRTYEYDPRSGKDIVLPPPRPGETYVIVPPGGRKLEYVRGGSSGSGSRSTSRSSTRSPTKRDPPLFKRLFTGFHTSNHDRSNSTGHNRNDSGSRRPRRLSY